MRAKEVPIGKDVFRMCHRVLIWAVHPEFGEEIIKYGWYLDVEKRQQHLR